MKVSFKVLLVAAVLAIFGSRAKATLLLYEPFNYSSGAQLVPGATTNDNGNGPGNGLVDTFIPPYSQNMTGFTWLQAGTRNTTANAATRMPHQITGSTATVWGGTSLAPSNAIYASPPANSIFSNTSGKAAAMMGGASARTDFAEMGRQNLPQQYGAGTVMYYSTLLKVSDLTGLTIANSNVNANNDGIIMFNNNFGQQTGTPNTWAGELAIRLGSVANTYNLGIRASTTVNGTPNTYWDGSTNVDHTTGATNFTTADTLFVVVRFTEGATPGTGGLNEVWINPNPSTFGASEGTAPAPDGSSAGTFSASGTADHLNSLQIGAGIANNAYPNELDLDEIRVGDTWLDVTTVPEPASLAGLVLGVGLLGRRRRH